MKISVNVSGAEVLSSAIRRVRQEAEWKDTVSDDYKQGFNDFAEALLKILERLEDDGR